MFGLDTTKLVEDAVVGIGSVAIRELKAVYEREVDETGATEVYVNDEALDELVALRAHIQRFMGTDYKASPFIGALLSRFQATERADQRDHDTYYQARYNHQQEPELQGDSCKPKTFEAGIVAERDIDTLRASFEALRYAHSQIQEAGALGLKNGFFGLGGPHAASAAVIDSAMDILDAVNAQLASGADNGNTEQFLQFAYNYLVALKTSRVARENEDIEYALSTCTDYMLAEAHRVEAYVEHHQISQLVKRSDDALANLVVAMPSLFAKILFANEMDEGTSLAVNVRALGKDGDKPFVAVKRNPWFWPDKTISLNLSKPLHNAIHIAARIARKITEGDDNLAADLLALRDVPAVEDPSPHAHITVQLLQSFAKTVTLFQKYQGVDRSNHETIPHDIDQDITAIIELRKTLQTELEATVIHVDRNPGQWKNAASLRSRFLELIKVTETLLHDLQTLKEQRDEQRDVVVEAPPEDAEKVVDPALHPLIAALSKVVEALEERVDQEASAPSFPYCLPCYRTTTQKTLDAASALKDTLNNLTADNLRDCLKNYPLIMKSTKLRQIAASANELLASREVIARPRQRQAMRA